MAIDSWSHSMAIFVENHQEKDSMISEPGSPFEANRWATGSWSFSQARQSDATERQSVADLILRQSNRTPPNGNRWLIP